jgi:chaperonin GroEL
MYATAPRSRKASFRRRRRPSCPQRLDNLKLPEEGKPVQIIRRAAQEPCKRIAMNAGTDGRILDKVKNGKGPFGFNAPPSSSKICWAGIIDPTKVVRTALQNAASVAGCF